MKKSEDPPKPEEEKIAEESFNDPEARDEPNSDRINELNSSLKDIEKELGDTESKLGKIDSELNKINKKL